MGNDDSGRPIPPEWQHLTGDLWREHRDHATILGVSRVIRTFAEAVLRGDLLSDRSWRFTWPEVAALARNTLTAHRTHGGDLPAIAGGVLVVTIKRLEQGQRNAILNRGRSAAVGNEADHGR